MDQGRLGIRAAALALETRLAPGLLGHLAAKEISLGIKAPAGFG